MIYAKIKDGDITFFQKFDKEQYDENEIYYDVYTKDTDLKCKSYQQRFFNRVKEFLGDVDLAEEDMQDKGCMLAFLAEEGFKPVSETFFYKDSNEKPNRDPRHHLNNPEQCL